MKLFISILIILILISIANANEIDFQDFLSIQSEKIAEIDQISAEFTQTEYIKTAMMERHRKGRLWADSKGRFRVEYDQPEKILMIFDNEYLIQHYIKDDEIQAVKSRDVENKTNPFYLYYNVDELPEFYNILSISHCSDYYNISLKDKQENSIISDIEIYFDVHKGFLMKIQSMDKENNTMTTIEFSNHNISEIDPQVFIIPPELIERIPVSPSVFYE